MKHVSNILPEILAAVLNTTLNQYGWTLVEMLDDQKVVVKDKQGNTVAVTDIGEFIERLKQDQEQDQEQEQID
jgi:hypothetical protein